MRFLNSQSCAEREQPQARQEAHLIPDLPTLANTGWHSERAQLAFAEWPVEQEASCLVSVNTDFLTLAQVLVHSISVGHPRTEKYGSWGEAGGDEAGRDTGCGP